ncbi:MAG TPA: hypothetical protein VNO33_23835 [Kofleriaceae bacterium]|nr:hypothetical protein [Kofleriaceae bacterium]
MIDLGLLDSGLDDRLRRDALHRQPIDAGARVRWPADSRPGLAVHLLFLLAAALAATAAFGHTGGARVDAPNFPAALVAR